MHDAWFDEGYTKGYEAGKSESYGKGWIEGQNSASIKQFDEYSVKLEERLNSRYDDGYTDGYKQGKQAGISKINLNTESVEQTELSKEYDKGFTKGYEEGFEEGKSEGYEIGKKANGISAKEIPGEYLSHIEEAYDDGYKEGYTDCREVAKMLNKYGIDEDGPCNDCKEEPGRDEEDGELIGPEHPEYDKGYYAGWEDGKNHIMQFIGNESSR
jgi:flagellar biosynthesis/type III secretory pathway protein FliH